MFGFLKKLFGGEPEAVKPAVPYKVEPMPTEVVEADVKPAAKARQSGKKPAPKKSTPAKRGPKPKAK